MLYRSTTDPVRRAHWRRLELALAAGLVAVVAAGLDTASADTPAPYPDPPVELVQAPSGAAAGGRLTFR